MEQSKPGFLPTLLAGAVGMLKGMALLGLAGFLIGGAVGGGFAMVSHMAHIGPVALAFAAGFAQLGVSIGGIAGAVTGVVQSREVCAPSADELANIAGMAYTKCAEAVRDKSVSEPSPEELDQNSTRYQDKLAAEQARALTR